MNLLSVKPEFHSNDQLHLHILCGVRDRTRAFCKLQSLLLSKHGIRVHGRTVVGCKKPLVQLWQYLHSPTPKEPVILEGYTVGQIPTAGKNHAAKETLKMARKRGDEAAVDKFMELYGVATLEAFEDIMAHPKLPASISCNRENPIHEHRFRLTKEWWVRCGFKHGREFVATASKRQSRLREMDWRDKTPEDHMKEMGPLSPCSCKAKEAWDIMWDIQGSEVMQKYIGYANLYYRGQLPWGGIELGGRPRGILLQGTAGRGKSLLMENLTFCVPPGRKFQLKSGSFVFDKLDEVVSPLVLYSPDLRLTKDQDVQQMLLSMEGKMFFADNKGSHGSDISYIRAPLQNCTLGGARLSARRLGYTREL